MKRLTVIAGLLVLAGCQSVSRQPDLRPALVKEFADIGVSHANTRRIILVGSEGGYGGDMQVAITEQFLIQEIWDTVYQSRPYRTWVASGFRKLRFYTDDKARVPEVELLVNATDRCHFEGAFDDAYRCPGINKILQPLFKAEYEKRKAANQSLKRTPKGRR